MTRPRIWRATVLSALLASGCAMGPDFSRPETPLSDHYGAQGEAVPVRATSAKNGGGQWWRVFESKDLDAVIALALAQNQDLEAAKATLSQVQSQAEATSAILLPHLDAHGSAAREKVDFTSYGLNFPSHTLNLYSIGATVSYSLDIFGHDHRLAEAAEARVEAERQRLNGADLTIAGNVVGLALKAAALAAEIDVATQLIDADRHRVDLLGMARKAGTISDREMADADGQLAIDSAILPPLKAHLAGVRHALAVLVGKAPAEWSPPAFTLSSFHVPEAVPVSLPSELVRQRPDILIAEAELHTASALVGVAEANRYPRITLSADITQWAVFPGQLWRDAATGANAGAGITAPLFHGGELAAEHDAAKDAYAAAQARYRQTVLSAFAQVATVMQGLVEDDEAVSEATKAVKATSQAFHFAELEQKNGTLGLLPVLVAERQERLSLLTQIEAKTQRLKDISELLLAMGGSWGVTDPARAENIRQ